jgi:hypothetical protein
LLFRGLAMMVNGDRLHLAKRSYRRLYLVRLTNFRCAVTDSYNQVTSARRTGFTE